MEAPGTPLFPPVVHQVSVAIDRLVSGGISDGRFGRSDVTREIEVYESEIASMSAARRAEFLAGRWCARVAMGRCGPELAAAKVPIGRGRAPRWPPGLVGAITHADNLASAAVARVRDARGVGLDVEKRMDAAIAAEVRATIGTEREIALARTGLNLDGPSAVTLVFSVKESLFKCLYPIVGRTFDYLDAEVIAVDEGSRRCRARIGVGLGAGIEAGFSLDARFEIDDRFVHTGVFLPAAQPGSG